MSEVKQVIVFRKDLLKGEHAIRKGKLIAQCCHASLGAFLKTCTRETDKQGVTTINLTFNRESFLDFWLNGIFTKIGLSVDSDEELVALYERIKSENPEIPLALITDAGKTEFHGTPTRTCLGIGPYWSEEIDKFTSDLKLL